MSGTTVWINPELQREIEEYRDARELEKTAIAVRRLIRLGLKVSKEEAGSR